MAHQRQPHPAIIVFEDILDCLADYYQGLPVNEDVIKSHAARITIDNLFNQLMIQFTRAQIDLHSHSRRLTRKKANILHSIHRAHGTTEYTHPLDATYSF